MNKTESNGPLAPRMLAANYHSPLNPRNVDFMQRLAKEAGMAAADYGQEERLHVPEGTWQPRRNCSIMTIESAVAFLPCLGSLTPELFAKVFTNERMRIEMPTTVRIFPGGVSLFLIWQESFATRRGSNSLTTP